MCRVGNEWSVRPVNGITAKSNLGIGQGVRYIVLGMIDLYTGESSSRRFEGGKVH